VLSRKRPAEDAETIDWLAAGSVVVACLGLGGWGLTWLADGRTFGVVMAVFGGIGLAYGVGDARAFRNGGQGGAWMVAHLQRMVAAFIATVSAVSAVNLTDPLGFVAWLWPTIVGAPLIAYWSNKYG
jgi:predicted RND superfamily exporter protein